MHGRRLADEESEPLAPGRPRAATPPPELLQLQRSVGNHAVGRMLAARQVLARDAAVAVDEAEVAKQVRGDYAAAVAAKNWELVATTLSRFGDEDMAAKLDALGEAEIRLVDDATKRATAAGLDKVSKACEKALQGKGVSAARSKAGAQYGDLKLEVTKVIDGVLDSVKYEYGVKISFTPDTAVVKADEIAFIQTSRITNAKGENVDWDDLSRNRATKNKTSVDRTSGFKQGWHAMKDDETGTKNLTKWTRKDAASQKTAELVDVPGSATLPSTAWYFETAVVSRSGPDAGTVYATVSWGFTVDDKMKITPVSQRVFNKQSTEMDAAVGKWNEQAKGPQGKSNVPTTGGQVALPTLK